MLRSIEEIAEQQKRKANKVVFPDSLAFSLDASSFDRHWSKFYMTKLPYLFWDAFKENAHYVIPLSLCVCHDIRSRLAFPILVFGTTYYFYHQKRRDPKYNLHSIDSKFYEAAKQKAKERQQLLRVLCWKHADLVSKYSHCSYIYQRLRMWFYWSS